MDPQGCRPLPDFVPQRACCHPWPDPTDRVLILIVAFGIEAVLAYPAPLFRAIGHPVSWIGALIAALDCKLNRPDYSDAMRRTAGIATVLLLLARQPRRRPCAGDGRARLPYLGFVLAVLIVAMLIAGGNLDQHVRAVASALRTEGLAGGRQSIAKIVGRDPETLDEAAVCRAAIESLAENASDGVTAPALWYLVGGLPGMIAYKAINTADSMIGHMSERYRAFGWAAAKLDDLVNLAGVAPDRADVHRRRRGGAGRVGSVGMAGVSA